jgi:hypothetical protein
MYSYGNATLMKETSLDESGCAVMAVRMQIWRIQNICAPKCDLAESLHMTCECSIRGRVSLREKGKFRC